MDTLTTDAKGEIACLRVRIEAIKKGVIVLDPPPYARYDLVLDYQDKLYRAQVKYAASKSPNSEGAIRIDLRRRKRCYTKDEIDVVLVYIPQIDRICWFPPEVFHNKPALQLRLAPAKNGQKNGCRMVDDYLW